MSGYLSNYVTELTGCGNVDSPWRVLALPGQRINFTLFDFGARGASSAATAGGTGAASGGGSGSMEMASAAAAAGGESHHGAYVCQVSMGINQCYRRKQEQDLLYCYYLTLSDKYKE